MRFTKLQSAGNDFVLVEAEDMNYNWSQLARAICQRHFGVGADGLLLLTPSEIADFGMRVFNTDGSEAEACGNGLRCLVKYTIDRGLAATDANEITVETIAGLRKARISTEAGKVNKIQVGMGKPEFEAHKIPVAIEKGKGNIVDIKFITGYPISLQDRELQLSFVSMGNPHAIYFTKQPVSQFPLAQIGPLVEKHELFPNRVNFEVANVISKKRIEIKVWERGVGETLACGSGACAVAVAAQLLGYVNSKAEVKLTGGILEVEWDRVGEVLLSGTAETVFSGEWPD
jgi:diaminopimelate epimerase